MLVRIACRRCRLASLWTDEPRCFLATVCHAPRRCEATLVDEPFGGATLDPPADCHRDERGPGSGERHP
jgi:hypothetical protein